MNLSTTQLRLIGGVLYFAAVVLILNFLAQFVIQIWPLRISELNWRVGSAGIFMDVLLSTVVPQILLFTAAFLNADRKVLAVLRWATLIVGILTVLLMLGFILDSVQIRAQLPQNMKPTFLKGALRAVFVAMMLSTLFIWVGMAIGKVLKSQGVSRVAGAVDSAQDAMLMIGTREPTKPNLRSIDASDAKDPKRDTKKDATSGLAVDL
jgi:hypothetical protein